MRHRNICLLAFKCSQHWNPSQRFDDAIVLVHLD